jgi:sugar lactone lactonase YvrE
LYAGTSQKYIFVADASKDSVFAYQENGYEGTIPPPQYSNRKLIRVSFGGTGSGPYQFRRPSGLAFSNRMLYVADPGNNRISRFKLTSDYE